MERRRILKSLFALLGAGGSARAAKAPRLPISKNSTRCQVSEFAQAAMDGVETQDSTEVHLLSTRAPNIAPTQKSASSQDQPR